MTGILPINIEDLLYQRGVESARVEYKASWDPKTTGYQVLKTICAYANDLQNLNGGYLILGVAEEGGKALLPPQGLPPEEVEAAQKWIRGHCNQIDPEYQPVFSPEKLGQQLVLVLWVPGSDNRPHKCPDGEGNARRYWVRLGSETVDAEKNGMLTNLMQMTAKIPFDDRRAPQAVLEDLREARVREFLHEIRSGLLEETAAAKIYRQMRISQRVNSHEVPKNVGLLFFSDNPESWFPGARIEVVQFAGDAAGNIMEEKTFRGPLHTQIRDTLNYLANISTQHIEKRTNTPETHGWVSYPMQALDEMVVNAIYHRSYEGISEPTKIYLYPDRIEVISYPGPVPGIELEHLTGERPLPPVPARNRRIGEFLKELRLAEGRGTGIPKIYRSTRENGSPDPRFDFDASRTYFRVTLPAHPDYVALAAVRDAAYLKATGQSANAIDRLKTAWRHLPHSALLAQALIRELSAEDKLDEARKIYDAFPEKNAPGFARVATAMADAYLNAARRDEALVILNQIPSLLSNQDAFDAAILERRAGRQKKAHELFLRAGDAILNDVRALHEFAQTKIKIAQNLRLDHPSKREARRRLLLEAEPILERVVQMDSPPTRRAWAWYDLGRVRQWLKKPASDAAAAFGHAHEILPDEERFERALRELRTEH
jgi:ATP-dependent DNA helicase RecG